MKKNTKPMSHDIQTWLKKKGSATDMNFENYHFSLELLRNKHLTKNGVALRIVS